MLETRIQVRFEAQFYDHWVMVTVDVRINTVESLEHIADEGGEGLGKGHANTRWKHGLIVDIGLHPRHEVFDVFRSGHLGGFFVRLGVLPKVLEFICRLHLWTALGRAKFSDGTVEQVDLVVEIDNIDSKPLVLVFTFRQLDCFS